MGKPHSHALRLGRWSTPGSIYLVTFTTDQRKPVFHTWFDASCVARALASPATWPQAQLLCWVLMPDHWHGLIELGDEPLSRAVARAKAVASRDWRRGCGSTARLWAHGFHDHALRKEENQLHVARYIIANPLRAGLVKRVGDYPYWDAVWL
ncbi:REP element-mobilizing transposase RayT [Pseudoxanthomonas sp. GM95]|uniref:REP-associated tyrosine transposase n=1 Tax=Pseudoxanthomonas sp. GM95 TaxID=1881043 RepID=UPI0008ADEBC4|nr:transposase [Pseudoxanthomonas sp. GM95]SEM41136.1 REP element-mobilizing transposase RayT [Pseudoxanthomonas sp. GM95]